MMAFLGARPASEDPATVPQSNRVVFEQEPMALGVALYAAAALADPVNREQSAGVIRRRRSIGRGACPTVLGSPLLQVDRRWSGQPCRALTKLPGLPQALHEVFDPAAVTCKDGSPLASLPKPREALLVAHQSSTNHDTTADDVSVVLR